MSFISLQNNDQCDWLPGCPPFYKQPQCVNNLFFWFWQLVSNHHQPLSDNWYWPANHVVGIWKQALGPGLYQRYTINKEHGIYMGKSKNCRIENWMYSLIYSFCNLNSLSYTLFLRVTCTPLSWAHCLE